MKKLFGSIIILIVFFMAVPPVQGKSMYIYRSRANWVKLSKLSNKQLAGEQLKHPFFALTTNQMTAMLLSLKMNKSKLFKKGIEIQGIFNLAEARKYAPLLVKALSEAAPNQVVNFSVVHKRPFFVIRNDHISIMNVFVTDDGLHFHFGKVYARLNGDYKQASNIDKAIRNAKSARITLTSTQGQRLLADGKEVILDLNFDFANNMVIPQSQELLGTDNPSKSPQTNPNQQQFTQSPEGITTRPQMDIRSRLQRLKELKAAKLISNSEYNKKRAEILSQL